MYFKIPELDNAEIKASDEKWRPVLILTSNSEKGLPDAFLRRCIYYNIPFPEKIDDLKKIVEARIGYITSTVDDALDLFHRLRAPNSLLVKKPATAELLGWLTAIRALCKHFQLDEDQSRLLKEHSKQLIDPTLSVLVKNEADQNPAKAVVQEWLSKK
jgi:MoxR-like ATPase